MTFDDSNSDEPREKITPLDIARIAYRMNGILIEFGVKSYVELSERYPQDFRRFVDSLPELTEEEKSHYRRNPNPLDNISK